MKPPRPVFIIGSGRSGTSVLTWAIGQHPNIIVTPETNWLTALASYLGAFYDIGTVAGAGHLFRFDVDRPAFFRHFGKGVDGFIRDSFEARFPGRRSNPIAKVQPGMAWVRSHDDPKERWVDGTPSNTPYVAILAKMFPEAKFINLVRNPVDVVHSWLGISWRAKEHAKARSVVEHIYHSQRAGYLAEAALGADRVMRLVFEDLTTSPESKMKAIAAFIGEEYTPHMIEPIASGKINSTGTAKANVEEELKSILDDRSLAKMRSWYDEAGDPGWRIALPEDAANELTIYASHKIPLPAS